MRTLSFCAAGLALWAAWAASAAIAVPGGAIGTLPTGLYRCDKPDANGLASVRLEERDFRVRPSSSYSANRVRGSYLLTGDRMVMTGGPFEGRKFLRTSTGYLRAIGPDGEPGEERCVLAGRGMR